MSEPTFTYGTDTVATLEAAAVEPSQAEDNLSNAKAFVWFVAGFVLLGAAVPLVVLAWRAAF